MLLQLYLLSRRIQGGKWHFSQEEVILKLRLVFGAFKETAINNPMTSDDEIVDYHELKIIQNGTPRNTR